MANYGVSAYGFYNSQNGDRKYNAEDFSKLFDGIVSDGILKGVSNEFEPELISGTAHVTIKPGKAWFTGTYTVLDNNLTINDITLEGQKIVAICIQVDKDNRTNKIITIEGENGETPNIIKDINNIWQYPIAMVTVNGSNVSLEDKRGSEDCPWASFNTYNIDDGTEGVGISYPIVISDYIKMYPGVQSERAGFANMIISNPMLIESKEQSTSDHVSRGFTFRLNADGTTTQDLIMGVFVPASTSSGTVCWAFSPKDHYNVSSNAHCWSIGRNGAPWYDGYIDTIHTLNQVDVTSDANLKENIKPLDERYEKMFNNLQPKSFSLKESPDKNIHTGFIAQDVKEAMDAAGLSTSDFSAYVDNGTKLSLRYGEFIALNTMMIQKKQDQIDQLQNEIENLRNELKSIENN